MSERRDDYAGFATHYDLQGWDWYAEQFDQTEKNLVGEKTPGYVYFDFAIERIKKFCPDVKLLLVLRDPVARAISAVNHHKVAGRINPYQSMDIILKEATTGSEIESRYQVLDRGNYFAQFARLHEHFPSSQIKVLIFEKDILKHPDESLKDALNFIGVANSSKWKCENADLPVHQLTINLPELLLNYYIPFARSYPFVKRINRFCCGAFPRKKLPSVIEDSTRMLLANYFHDSNERLFELLGHPIDEWN